MQYNIYAASWQGIQYYGRWVFDGTRRYTQTQYSKCIFTFKGSGVKLFVNGRPDGGKAEVFIDGKSCGEIDCTNEVNLKICPFETEGLYDFKIHELTVSCRKVKEKPNAVLEICGFAAEEIVDYPTYLRDQKLKEYAMIERGEKEPSNPKDWVRKEYLVKCADDGVGIKDKIFSKLINDNANIVKYDFKLPYYCEGESDIGNLPGPGWSHFLPASNEARLLAGAVNTLRWQEDKELDEIVRKLLSDMKKRARKDGYHNYYPESESFGDVNTFLSERKNYDRVFWTRAMLYADEMGYHDALKLARNMYDWLEGKPEYLSKLIQGTNATNAGPGLPLMANSFERKDEDMLTEQKYVDQDYFLKALADGVSMAFSAYPGDRPHCYELLILETIIEEYRATGLDKYKNAMFGGWEIWKNYYRHLGGAAAICEVDGPYPPGSYYISTGHNGETCASVFWSMINAKMMMMYPGKDEYVNELEDTLYNSIAACRLPDNSWTRYHLRFHGEKEWGRNFNNCCEVSSTMFIPTVPQYICTYTSDSTYVNLPIASSHTKGLVSLDIVTDFPYDNKVKLNITRGWKNTNYIIRVRIPSWNEGEVTVKLNGNEYAKGTPGSYVSIRREWQTGDTVEYEFNFSPRLIKYTGHDQPKDNSDRYALMAGPILMALTGVDKNEVLPLRNRLTIEQTIPRIDASPEEFLKELKEIEPLKYTWGRYTFVPYYSIDKEYFTCYPIIEK